MRKKILFASNNKGKYNELVNDFKKAGIDLLFYTDVQDNKLVLEENSEILAVNAREKAIQAAKQTGYMCLGDDSGVYITALDYFPGAHSRRWSFDEVDDSSRNKAILEMMKDEEDRSVYLISRFSLVDEDGNEIYKTCVKNEFNVTYEIIGNNGFGYDAILSPAYYLVHDAYTSGRLELGSEGFDAATVLNGFKSVASLTQEQKNAINNRGRIAGEIKSILEEKYGE